MLILFGGLLTAVTQGAWGPLLGFAGFIAIGIFGGLYAKQLVMDRPPKRKPPRPRPPQAGPAPVVPGGGGPIPPNPAQWSDRR
jgi:hypothetical protein